MLAGALSMATLTGCSGEHPVVPGVGDVTGADLTWARTPGQLPRHTPAAAPAAQHLATVTVINATKRWPSGTFDCPTDDGSAVAVTAFVATTRRRP